jgi:hypothetical protein
MNCLSFIVAFMLWLRLVYSEPYPTGVYNDEILSDTSSADENTDGLDYLDAFDTEAFMHACLSNHDDISLEELSNLASELELRAQVVGICYCHVLRDMIERGDLESFKLMYPLVKFDQADDYDILMMLECVVHDRPEILELMVNHNFDSQRFVDRLLGLGEYSADPASCIKVVSIVAAHDAYIKEKQIEIYTELLPRLLNNEFANEEDFEWLANDLINFGADVSAETFNEIIQKYPDNTDLHQLLHSAQL